MDEQTLNTLKDLVNIGAYDSLAEAIEEYKIRQRRNKEDIIVWPSARKMLWESEKKEEIVESVFKEVYDVLPALPLEFGPLTLPLPRKVMRKLARKLKEVKE